MYSLVKVPSFATKDIYSFSKQEAKEYFKWFVNIKNERLQILELSVKELYPEWQLNYTKNSLAQLYEWFSKKVMYRNLYEDEKEEIEKQISKTPIFIGIINIPKETFTEETVSICFDIGIYLGETLIKNFSNIGWTQKLSSTNDINYAQPLIGTKSKQRLINPRRLSESLARYILDNDNRSVTFLDMYDKWSLQFGNNII